MCSYYEEVKMLFSIIIPTYNREKLIGLAINSVINQTFIDWELIIIDDGSTDKTKEVVKPYLKDKRVKYFFQKNAERSSARNNGILKSQGKYICFLDSDDKFLTNHLQDLNDLIQKSKNEFFYSLKIGDIHNYRQNKFDEIFLSDIHSQQVCIKRHLLEKNNFNTNLNVGEDTELWMRIILESEVECTKKVSVDILDHDERTIHIKNIQPVFKHYLLVKKLCKQYKSKLSSKTIRVKKSGALFRISRHYIFVDDSLKAIWYMLLSIIKMPNQPLTWHKLAIILALFKIYPQRVIVDYKENKDGL